MVAGPFRNPKAPSCRAELKLSAAAARSSVGAAVVEKNRFESPGIG
jgi:hypothetical protein